MERYRYETHLHTSPVSKCAVATVEESLDYYKSLNYDGVFVTNHFIDGNINIDKDRPYEEKINFYFSDYEKALEYGKKIGIKVFLGVELTYEGTDFLIYGPDKEWFLKNPQIEGMKKSDELKFLMENGALVIQAHPFRESRYMDHIRLYPRCVHGFEVCNASRTDFANKLADIYANQYELLKFAGSDNHTASKQKNLAGVMTTTPIENESDFIERIKSGNYNIFNSVYENGIIVEEKI